MFARTLLGSLLFALLTLVACREPQETLESDEASNAPLELPSSNLVDLTHPFNAETLYWPTADGFSREVTAEGTTEQGYFYAAGRFSSAEHGGTHLDAPFHFAEDGWKADEIPLDRLIGQAVVIDVTDHVTSNPDYRITSEDIEAWESENGPLADDVIVLFRTGFGSHWPDPERYLGTSMTGPEAVRELHFPGLHPEAATWLVENRKVKAVGLDTASIDYGQSQEFETHQVLFERNVPVFENVANLDQIPTEGALVVALPMKIENGSGGPLRIVAFTP